MSTENAVLSAKAADLIEKADSLFCDAKNKNNGGAKAAEILALFESNTEVVISAEWVGNEPPPKGVLIVKWKNGVRRPDVHFNNSICDSPALRAANGQYGTAMERRKESNRDAIFLQKALEQGNVLFFASDGSELTLPITAKSSIAEIIKNENSGRKELIEKLMKLGFSHRGATDLIRNYTPD